MHSAHNIVYQFAFDQNNQADLENATEVLSGYLERDISQDSLQDIKQKVQDKYRSVKELYCRPPLFNLCSWTLKECPVSCRYCESRRRVLLQHVHEGYEKDLWEYIEDWGHVPMQRTLEYLDKLERWCNLTGQHGPSAASPLANQPLLHHFSWICLTKSSK